MHKSSADITVDLHIENFVLNAIFPDLDLKDRVRTGHAFYRYMQMLMQVRLTFVVKTLETQPLQPATVGGGARVPKSLSSCRPMLISKPSCPAGAAICNPYGCPVLSSPMGKASAAYQAKHEQANHLAYGCPMLSSPMGKSRAAYQAQHEQANNLALVPIWHPCAV